MSSVWSIRPTAAGPAGALQHCATEPVHRKTAPILSGAAASCLSRRIVAIPCFTQHGFEVCCAHFSQQLQVFAVDQSQDAVDLTTENAER